MRLLEWKCHFSPISLKTIKDVLVFCNSFTYFNHCTFQRVIELDHVRDCISESLSKCDHIDENAHIKVLGFIDDILLMVFDGNVENINHEKNNLRVGFLHLLCLEQLY